MKPEHQVARIAEAMIKGDLPFLDGATELCSLRFEINAASDNDPDFIPFVAIDSETDHLPRLAQREFWSPEALEKLQREIDESEGWARSIAWQACQNLCDRFKAA